jgi:hypothetical protein
MLAGTCLWHLLGLGWVAVADSHPHGKPYNEARKEGVPPKSMTPQQHYREIDENPRQKALDRFQSKSDSLQSATGKAEHKSHSGTSLFTPQAA